MAIDKEQTSQIVNDAKLPVVGSVAREQQDSLNSRFDKELGQPLRVFASVPADSKLNIASNVIVAGDGASKFLTPIDGLNQSFAAATIDMLTGALSVAGSVTVNGATFALPASVTGQYRRMALSFQNSGKIDVNFSPSVATYGALQDIVSVFAPLIGTNVAYVDLIGTTTATPGSYKTASSAGVSVTSIIENAVSGASSIFRAPLGGTGGSGTGNANALVDKYEDQLNLSPYNFVAHTVLAVDAATRVGSVSGTAYDPATKTVKFTANAQVVTTVSMLDTNEFPAAAVDITTVDVVANWNRGTTTQTFSVPAAFVYEVTRDQGNLWTTVPMTRIGLSDAFRGTLAFSGAETPTALHSLAVQDANRILNATTQQAVSQPFTLTMVAEVVSNIQLSLAKAGSPSGNYYVSIVKDSGGNPSTVASDVMVQSAYFPLSGVATGPATVTHAISATVLAPGTYHVVIGTDATYQASFVSTTTELRVRERQTTPSSPFVRAYNAGTWAIATTNSNLFYTINGRVLDLKVRVTSAGSPTYPCGLDGLAAFYWKQDNGGIGGGIKPQRFTFDSVADNTNVFTLNFLADPDKLTVRALGGVGVYMWPDFEVAGNTVTFPANFFNNGGISKTMRLVFDPNSGGSTDNSDSNARLMSTSHLGSPSGTDDRSVAGRGIYLRDSSGVLREIYLDANDYIQIQSTAQAPVRSYGLATSTAAGLLPATPVSMDNALATAFGFKTYKHGTTYNGGIAPTITVSGTGLGAVEDSSFIPYQMQDGVWRLRFMMAFTTNGTTTITISAFINGVAAGSTAATLASGNGQAMSGFSRNFNVAVLGAEVRADTNGFQIQFAASTAVAAVIMSGDIYLASKPTWAY